LNLGAAELVGKPNEETGFFSSAEGFAKLIELLLLFVVSGLVAAAKVGCPKAVRVELDVGMPNLP